VLCVRSPDYNPSVFTRQQNYIRRMLTRNDTARLSGKRTGETGLLTLIRQELTTVSGERGRRDRKSWAPERTVFFNVPGSRPMPQGTCRKISGDS
jgi:hypothetical protein